MLKRILGKNRGGFTLLEVVLAIGILGMALVVVIRGYVLSLRSMERAAVRTEAFALAEELMTEYKLGGDFFPHKASGGYEKEGEDFRWERTADFLVFEGDVLPGVLRVEISVLRNGEEFASLTTFVRAPD